MADVPPPATAIGPALAAPVTAARAAAGAITTTIVSVIPVFLVGGMAVQISRELRLDPAELGMVISGYFGASALLSMPCGALVERYGSTRAARAAIVLSAASLLAVGALASSLAGLLLILLAGAAANALGQLAANLLLARHVPIRRQGLTFGVKQAAIPLSTLLVGIAVPLVALTWGWRWAFVLAAVAGLGALALVPADQPDHTHRPRARNGARPGTALAVVAVAAGLASGAASPLGAFLVSSAVAGGVSEAAAGATLAFGSGIGILARIGGGWLADRRARGHIAVIAGMLALGAGGLTLLAVPGAAALLTGTALGFSLGWSWPGLLNFAVAKLHPAAPAAATAITQSGVYVGGCLGPLGFGALVAAESYRAAWLAAAVAMLLASALMAAARRMLLGHHAMSSVIARNDRT